MQLFWLFRGYLDERTDAAALLETARAMTREGVEMFLVTGYRKTKPFEDERIIYIASARVPLLNYALQCVGGALALARRVRPGDIIMTEPYTALWGLVFALVGRLGLARFKVILDIRTLPVDRGRFLFTLDRALFKIGLFIARGFFRGATLITPAMKEILGRYLTGLRMGIWPSAVNMDLFDPSRYDREKIRRELGLNGKTVFLYWGALSSRGRGLTEAAEAFRRANLPDALFLFVGRGDLAGEIAEAGGPSVRVLPPVPHDEIPRLIAAADFAVIPFKSIPVIQTSYPIKLLESLAMEKPVVSTDIRPVRDLIGERKDCFVAPRSQGLERAFADAAKSGARTRGLRDIALRFSVGAVARHIASFVRGL